MPGFVCVSTEIKSILRPRMPPAALISLTASLTPLSKLVPAVAPPPDSSTMLDDLDRRLCGGGRKRNRQRHGGDERPDAVLHGEASLCARAVPPSRQSFSALPGSSSNAVSGAAGRRHLWSVCATTDHCVRLANATLSDAGGDYKGSRGDLCACRTKIEMGRAGPFEAAFRADRARGSPAQSRPPASRRPVPAPGPRVVDGRRAASFTLPSLGSRRDDPARAHVRVARSRGARQRLFARPGTCSPIRRRRAGSRGARVGVARSPCYRA